MIRAIGGAGLAVAAGLCLLAGGAEGALQADNATAQHGSAPLEHMVISQRFGCTPLSFEPLNPACPEGHFHTGIDFAAAEGTPVHAAAAGHITVIASRSGFGLHILLDHGGGLVTLYGHLSRVLAVTGQDVAAGEVIGAVGSTGNSTGPHLHFEVQRGGHPVDPLNELNPQRTNHT